MKRDAVDFFIIKGLYNGIILENNWCKYILLNSMIEKL